MGWFAQAPDCKTQYDKVLEGAHIFANLRGQKAFQRFATQLAQFSNAETLVLDIDKRLAATDSTLGILSVNGMANMGSKIFHERTYLAKLATALYLCSRPPNSLPGSGDVHVIAMNYQKYEKAKLGPVINDLILEWKKMQAGQAAEAHQRAQQQAFELLQRSGADAIRKAQAQEVAAVRERVEAAEVEAARKKQADIIEKNARLAAAAQAEKVAQEVDRKVREVLQAISLNSGFVDVVAGVLEKDFIMLTDLKAAMAWPNGATIMELIKELNILVGDSSKICKAVVAADRTFNKTLEAVGSAQAARLDAAKSLAENALASAGSVVLGPLGAYLGSAVGAALTAVVATAVSVVEQEVKYSDRQQMIDAIVADGLTAGSSYATTYAQGQISGAISSVPGQIVDTVTSGAGITAGVSADKIVSSTNQIVEVKKTISATVFTFITGPGVTTENCPGRRQQVEMLATTQQATQDKLMEHVNSAFTNLWKEELKKELPGKCDGPAAELMRYFVEMGNEDPTVKAGNRGGERGGGSYGPDEQQFLKFCLLKIFPVVQSETIRLKLEARRLEEGSASAEFLQDVKTLCKYFAHSFKLALEQTFKVGATSRSGGPLNGQDQKDLETFYEIYLWSLCYKVAGTDIPPKEVIARLRALGVMELWNQGLGISNALSRANPFSNSKTRMATDGRLGIYNSGKLRWSDGTKNEVAELKAFSEKVCQYMDSNQVRLFTGEMRAGAGLKRIEGFAKESWIKKPV